MSGISDLTDSAMAKRAARLRAIAERTQRQSDKLAEACAEHKAMRERKRLEAQANRKNAPQRIKRFGLWYVLEESQ